MNSVRLHRHLVRSLTALGIDASQSEGLQPLACYAPPVRHIFARWPDREVTLVMDRTDLEKRLSSLTLGAAYRKRLLPLAWEVSDFGGSSAGRQSRSHQNASRKALSQFCWRASSSD